MTPQTRLDVDVDVLVTDSWFPGTLEYWRKDSDRWAGFVRYANGRSETRIGWFDEDAIRRA